jgi:ribonuclease HI
MNTSLLCTLYFDGKAEPNPGKGGAGAVIYDRNGKTLFEKGRYFEFCTNNQAEYAGLIVGLEMARDNGIKKLHVYGDSLLVINQVTKKWKIKNEELSQLCNYVFTLLHNFDNISFEHVLRNKNTHADAITNEVVDCEEDIFRKH